MKKFGKYVENALHTSVKRASGWRQFKQAAKLFIPSTLNIDLPYTEAFTIDFVCSKMLNHGLNHWLFLSLFKLIPCPIH